jgi:phosphoglycolate phosphatase
VIFKAVIFDLDGTLVDSLEDLAGSMNKVLKDRGFLCHDLEAYKFFIGDGIETLVRRALPEKEQTREILAGCTEALRSEYNRNWANKTCLYQGIPELLDSLTVRGLLLNILSNKPDEFTKLAVAKFLSNWQFAFALGARPQMPKKPDPAGALKIAGALAIPTGEILYVGDTGIDMETATRAGMFAVGVLWGFRSEEELLAGGAKAVVTKPEELLRFF